MNRAVYKRHNIAISCTLPTIPVIQQLLTMKQFVLVLGLLILSKVHGYNILTVFNFPAKSTTIGTFRPILEKLASRGHNVTVISFFRQDKVIPNYVHITIRYVEVSDMGKLLSNISFIEPNRSYFKYMAPVILKIASKKLCDLLFEAEAVQDLFRSNITYDVVMLPIFQSECVYQLAKKFSSPTIGFHSSIMMHWTADRFALPYSPAVVPNNFLPFTTKMAFLERVENALVTWGQQLYYQQVMVPADREILRTHFGVAAPEDLKDLMYNTSLFISNTHFSINLPKISLPNVIEVGGMHIGKPKTLKKVC